MNLIIGIIIGIIVLYGIFKITLISVKILEDDVKKNIDGCNDI